MRLHIPSARASPLSPPLAGRETERGVAIIAEHMTQKNLSRARRQFLSGFFADMASISRQNGLYLNSCISRSNNLCPP
jgi:hypothetical protein